MTTVPRFPQFREITIEDKPFFQDVITQSPPQISEYTYTNLFIWNYYYHFLWCIWDGCICIMARPKNQAPYLLPPIGTCNPAERIIALLTHLQGTEATPTMRRVPESLVTAHLATHDHLAVIPDRNNSDYVYLTEDLIKLEGNRYHGKKNHFNKFKKNHTYSYASLTPELVKECLALESRWCDIRHCNLFPGLVGEERAIFEALTNMDHLDSTKRYTYSIAPWSRDVAATIYHWQTLFGWASDLMPGKFRSRLPEIKD